MNLHLWMNIFCRWHPGEQGCQVSHSGGLEWGTLGSFCKNKKRDICFIHFYTSSYAAAPFSWKIAKSFRRHKYTWKDIFHNANLSLQVVCFSWKAIRRNSYVCVLYRYRDPANMHTTRGKQTNKQLSWEFFGARSSCLAGHMQPGDQKAPIPPWLWCCLQLLLAASYRLIQSGSVIDLTRAKCKSISFKKIDVYQLLSAWHPKSLFSILVFPPPPMDPCPKFSPRSVHTASWKDWAGRRLR